MVIAEMMFLANSVDMYIPSIQRAFWLGLAFCWLIFTGIVFGEEITVSYAALTAAYMVTRGELIKVAKLPEPGQLFDYSIIKKVYTELKKSWKPKP